MHKEKFDIENLRRIVHLMEYDLSKTLRENEIKEEPFTGTPKTFDYNKYPVAGQTWKNRVNTINADWVDQTKNTTQTSAGPQNYYLRNPNSYNNQPGKPYQGPPLTANYKLLKYNENPSDYFLNPDGSINVETLPEVVIYSKRKPLYPKMELPLKIGSKGESVKRLQRFFNIYPDGYYSRYLSEMVKERQKSLGLKQTGILDVETWNKMHSVPRVASMRDFEISQFLQNSKSNKLPWDKVVDGVAEIDKKWDYSMSPQGQKETRSQWSMTGMSEKDLEDRKKFEEILNKVNNRKSLRYNLDVPEGFSPFTYDDFIDELRPYSTKLQSAKIKATTYGQDTSFFNRNNPIYLNALAEYDKKRKQILSKYYNPKFPKGITQEDLEYFNKTKAEYKNLISELEKKYQFKVYIPSGAWDAMEETYEFDYDKMSDEDKKKYDQAKAELINLDTKFGYDGRTAFDKFMDSNWGLVAQMVVNTAIIALASIAAPATGGFSWGLAADALFNVSIGLYQVSRQQQGEAVMSFVFAILPYCRNLYRIAKAPTKEVCESIARKVAGINLDNADEINAMLRTMTEEESSAFKSIAFLPPSAITPEVEAAIKARQAVLEKTTTRGQRFVKGVYQFGKEAATDLGIAYVASKAFNSLMGALQSFGIPVKTEEDLQKLKTYLNDEATPQDLQLIEEYVYEFYKNNPQEVEQAKREGFKIEKQGPKILKYSKENLEKAKQTNSKEKEGALNALPKY